MDEDDKILIEMQKSLGRLEGTVNSFLTETRHRLEKLEHLSQSSGRETRTAVIASLSCFAAVVSTVMGIITKI